MFIIDRYTEAAQAVKEAAAVLGRTKAFEVVDRILSVTLDDSQFEQQPLAVINEELIHAGKLNQISIAVCTGLLLKAEQSLKLRILAPFRDRKLVPEWHVNPLCRLTIPDPPR